MISRKEDMVFIFIIHHIRNRMTFSELEVYVDKQIENQLICRVSTKPYIPLAVRRTNKCLFSITSKYHLGRDKEEIPFSVYNTVEYTIFLYNLARVAYEMDCSGVNAEKIYYLNKILNAVDIFYEVCLPSVWWAEHPLGSVMGRAIFSDYFFFYQGCTVGGNREHYPRIGKNVTMFSNSKILGRCNIGDNVLFSANSYVKDTDIPNNCIVFGQSPNLVIKQMSSEEITERNVKWKRAD